MRRYSFQVRFSKKHAKSIPCGALISVHYCAAKSMVAPLNWYAERGGSEEKEVESGEKRGAEKAY